MKMGFDNCELQYYTSIGEFKLSMYEFELKDGRGGFVKKIL